MCMLCPRTANHAMLSAQNTLCGPTNCALVCIVQGMCLKPLLVDFYPLLVLRLPNDFLFHLEPKVARWDPLHHYWTTNSVPGVDINMGGWGWGWGERQYGWVEWGSPTWSMELRCSVNETQFVVFVVIQLGLSTLLSS